MQCVCIFWKASFLLSRVGRCLCRMPSFSIFKMSQLAAYLRATPWRQHKIMATDPSTGQLRKTVAVFPMRPVCLLEEEYADLALCKQDPVTKQVACWCAKCYAFSVTCYQASNDDALRFYSATLEWSREEKYTFVPCPCPRCLPNTIECKGGFDDDDNVVSVNFFLRGV